MELLYALHTLLVLLLFTPVGRIEHRLLIAQAGTYFGIPAGLLR